MTRATLLAEIEPDHGDIRPWRLAILSFGYTIAGAWLMIGIAGASAGALSVFLAAAALAPRLTEVIAANRDDIWVRKRASFEANRHAATRVLAILVGMALAYAVTAIALGGHGTRRVFSLALDTARLSEGTITTRRFGSFWSLLSHNGLVLLSFFALAFIYRTYGALLALAWNACVWAVVITILIARGAAIGGSQPMVFVTLSLVAVLPHMLLEAAAYGIGALAGIFLSRGITKYGLRDPHLWQVGRAVSLMAMGSLVLLACASLAEHLWAPWWLDVAQVPK
ncbi:MAG: stage II sporulation protein M [Deltaproteobacteria bacterium]|nr:stage II sporulation protein M [Deltaproteobacteria bacterium]